MASFALGALLHITLTLIILLASMWLVLSSGPDEPDGPMKDMIADGLLIVALWPAALLDRLGLGLLETGLAVALPVSTIGWCAGVFFLMASARALTKSFKAT